MKIGQTVTLVSGHGSAKPVTVEAITGVGPSRFKVLKLDGGDTPHERDKQDGAPFWHEGEPRTSYEGLAAPPKADLTALPEGYAVTHVAGGYYELTDPSGDVVEGPSNGKWQGKDGAARGAWEHVARSALDR